MPKNSILYKIQAIDEASKVFAKVREKAKGLKSQLESLKKAQENLDKASGKLARMSTVAIGGFAIATKFLYDFEKQMNTISAISGKSQEQLKGFRDKAVQLGNDTQYTTTQVADLGVSFARSGFSIEETTDLLSTALNMATAGNLTLGESADILGSAIKGFSLQIGDATRISDVFAAGANHSKMVMQDFLELISKVGAVSQLKGVSTSLEENVAMFGILMDSAIPASVAATGLGSSMLRLSSNTKMVVDTLAELGIDHAKFQTMDFMQKLDLLHQKQKRMSTAQAQQIFGLEHAKTMLTLLKNYDQLKGKLEIVKNAAGSSAKAQEAMMQGLVGSFDRFTSALEGTVFALGENGLTAKLSFAFDLMTKFVNKFSNSSSAFKDFVINAGFVMASLIGISVILQVISYSLGIFRAIVIMVNVISAAWAFINGLVGLSITGIMVALAPVVLGVVAFVGVLYGLYRAYKYVSKLWEKNQEEKKKKAEKNAGLDSLGQNTKNLEKMYVNNKANNKISGDINVNVSSQDNLKTTTKVGNTENLKLAEQN